MALQLRDRKWDYPALRRGQPCVPLADCGLMPYQHDCVEWLFREQPDPSTWEAGDPVVLVPSGGGRPGRLGVLVSQLACGRWRLSFKDGGAEIVARASKLWCPRSDYQKAVLSVCLDPGMGKTAVLATYLRRLPPKARACVFTASGLVEPTRKEMTRWLKDEGGITVAATRKCWQQAMERGARFVLTSYAIARQGGGLEAARDAFDTLLFDEAHTVFPTILRLFPSNMSSAWLRPYPRVVLSSGTPPVCGRFMEFTDEVFCVRKSSAAASAALGMPDLCIRMAKREPPGSFDLASYMRTCMAELQHHKNEQLAAELWWAYHVSGYRWDWADNWNWYNRVLDGTRGLLDWAQRSMTDEGMRREALKVQRSGLAFVLQLMFAECGHEDPWNWRVVLYGAPRYAAIIGTLPDPTPLDPGRSIAGCPFFCRHGPSAKFWRDLHTRCFWLLCGGHGAWSSHVLGVIQESLRVHPSEHPPQVLLHLPEASSKRRRDDLLADLCNLPQRNKLCDSPACGYKEKGCRKNHDKSHFSKDGKRLLRGCGRTILGCAGRDCLGQIQESPGLESTRIYVVSPEHKSEERSRTVEAFSRDCWSGVAEIRPFVAQLGLRRHANRFLHVLGVADIAAQLEALLVSRGLLLGLGETLDVGYNLQQRASGIALAAFEHDFDKVLQLCGRIQRIPRALGKEAGALTVVMPCLRHTIEDVVLSPLLVATAKGRSDAVGLE